METERDAFAASRRQRGGNNAVKTKRSRHSGTNTAIDTESWRQREVDALTAGDREIAGGRGRQRDGGDISTQKEGAAEVVKDRWRQRHHDRDMSTEIEKERCVYREMPIQRWKRPQRDIVRWVHGGVDIHGRLIAKRLEQQVRHSWNIYSAGDGD